MKRANYVLLLVLLSVAWANNAIAAMPTNGALTDLLNTVGGFVGSGQAALAPTARWILGVLITLELVWFGLQIALVGGDAGSIARDGLRKVIFLGLFVWFVSQFSWLIQQVVNGFIWVGATAGGGAATPILNNPSAIIDAGLVAAQPVLDHVKAYGPMGMVVNLPDLIISGLCALLILFAFFILAIQVFVTYVEFGIVATLGFVLIPFGVNGKLAFLAEKVFGAIISFGVRLMVLAFVITIALPVLAAYSLPPDPLWPEMFNMVAIVFAVLALAWHAPSVAAGMMAGGPSLTANTAAGTVLAGGLGLGLLGFGAARAAQAGVQATAAAANAAGGSAAAVTAGVSAVNTGARIGAATAAVGGAGVVGQVVGGLEGAGRAVAAPLVSAAEVPAQAVAAAFRKAWEGGQIRGWKLSGDRPPVATSGAIQHHGSSSPGGMRQVVEAAHMVRSAIPHESSPSGGASPTIHD